MLGTNNISRIKEVGKVGGNVLVKSKEARTASLKVAMELYIGEMENLAFKKADDDDDDNCDNNEFVKKYNEYWKILDFNVNSLLGLMRKDGYINESEYWFYNGEIEALESYYENRRLG